MPSPFRRILLLTLAILTSATNAFAQGQRYALLVGVNEYEHANLSILRYAENDVTALSQVLRGDGYAVTLLTGTAGKKNPEDLPTRANIQRQLERLTNLCKREDTFLVALAGHGLQFDDAKDSFFCPQDARPAQPATLISLQRLYQALDDSGAGVKLLFVDACRNDPKAGRGRGVNGDSAPRPPRGVAALFSCSAGEQAFETEKYQHGVFFHHILRGLRGEESTVRNRKGEVTWDLLQAHVREQVATDVARVISEDARQTPSLNAGELSGRPPVLLREIGWLPLCEGEDLQNWNGQKDLWTIRAGEIVGKAPEEKLGWNTFLWTKKTYKNFEMKVQVKLSSGNSGIQVRSAVRVPDRHIVTGPQVEVAPVELKDDGDEHIWGSVVTEPTARPCLLADPALIRKILRPREFNDYHIRIVGEHITIKLNGTTTVDDDFPSMPGEGTIAFQIHAWHPGMEVTFRNPRIKLLP